MSRWNEPVTPATVSAFLRLGGICLLLLGLLILNVLMLTAVGPGTLRGIVLITDVFGLSAAAVLTVDLLYQRSHRHHLAVPTPDNVACLDHRRATKR